MYDGPKADIWSLGVVLFVLVCGYLPFDAKTLHTLRSRVLSGKFRIPFFMSTECEELIRKMLQIDPEKRLNIDQILKTKWMTQNLDVNQQRDMDELIYHYDLSDNDGNINEVVLDHMLQLPGLEKEKVIESVQNHKFDHISAIHDLLVVQLNNSPTSSSSSPHSQMAYSSNLPVIVIPQRKSSITTGIVDRNMLSDLEVPQIPVFTTTYSPSYLPVLHDPAILEKYGEYELSGESDTDEPAQRAVDKYLCSRRHTVGPGDTDHEQVAEERFLGTLPLVALHRGGDDVGPYLGHPISLLPQTNLPQNLPLVQNFPPQNFSIKDQHLLKPPPIMGAAGGFGRRASDGGANLQMCFQTQVGDNNTWRRTSGQEKILKVSHNIPQCSSADTVHSQHISLQDDEPGPKEDEIDPQAVEKYISGRGANQRVTLPMVGQKESDSIRKVTPSRSRRTGLLTVTERPPVIHPELLRNFERRLSQGSQPSYNQPTATAPYSSTSPGITSGIPFTQHRHSRRSSAPLYTGWGTSEEKYVSINNKHNNPFNNNLPPLAASHNLANVTQPGALSGQLASSIQMNIKTPPRHHPYTSTSLCPSNSSPCQSPPISSPLCSFSASDQSASLIQLHPSMTSSSAKQCLVDVYLGNTGGPMDNVNNIHNLHLSPFRGKNLGHRRLATVVESNFIEMPFEEDHMEDVNDGRDSYKDYLSCERYSPVNNTRRASDSTISLSDINQEFQKLQKYSGPIDAGLQAELQRGHSLLWRPGAVSPVGIGTRANLSQTPSPPIICSPAPVPRQMTMPCSRCPPSSSPVSPIHLLYSHSTRSPTPSPPISLTSTTPVIGSPQHQTNIEGTSLSLSQLQLQATSSPGSPLGPLSPHHQSSPPRCFSPQSLNCAFSTQPQSGNASPLLRATPPPPTLSLDSIREEPRYSQHLSDALSMPLNCTSHQTNPQISITDETGDQMFIASSGSSSDGSDEMDTSPFPSPVSPPDPPSPFHHYYCLSKGLSLDSPLPGNISDEHIIPRPSIMRGTGIACIKKATDNENFHCSQNDKNLVRQNALAENTTSKHQMFISNVELRHSFPPFLSGTNTIEGDQSPSPTDTGSVTLSDSENNMSHPSSSSHVLNFHQRVVVENEQLHKTGSGSLLFGVPNKWSRLPVRDIVGAIVDLVHLRAPSLVREDIRDCGLCLRDPTGAEVELEVSQGPAADSRALKMRRVSGDDSQYSQLCEQLINCMTT